MMAAAKREPAGRARRQRRTASQRDEGLRQALAQVEAEDWPAAAAGFAASAWVREAFPVLSARVLLLAGRAPDAAAVLAEALRRDPTDARLLHTLFLVCHRTLEAEQGEAPRPLVEEGIALWVALLHREDFWPSWLGGRLERYGQAPPSAALPALRQEVTGRLGQCLEELLSQGSSPEERRLLLSWELAAAEQLAAAGGLPLAEGKALVCGPLMLRFLGWESRFGGFVSQLLEHRPNADRVLRLLRSLRDLPASASRRAVDPGVGRRLQQLFSPLGRIRTLLALGRSPEALEALGQLACPACSAAGEDRSRFPAAGSLPAVCAASCSEFGQRHPGYGGPGDGAQNLARHALELAIKAHLAHGELQIAAREMELDKVAASWREAGRLASRLGREERTRQRIAETALGRVEGLARSRRWDEAIALLEAAREIASVALLAGRLAELLNARGVRAVNDQPSRWEAAAADFREAVRLAPHASHCLVNLSRTLRRWAEELAPHHPRQAVAQLLSALAELRRGLAGYLAGDPAVKRQLRRAGDAARRQIVALATELAEGGGFDQASQLLEEGRRALPDDPVLSDLLLDVRLDGAERLAEDGDIAGAAALLREVIRELRGARVKSGSIAAGRRRLQP